MYKEFFTPFVLPYSCQIGEHFRMTHKTRVPKVSGNKNRTAFIPVLLPEWWDILA